MKNLVNHKSHRCKGKTKRGKPCSAAATEGGLCFFHANPDKAREFGRIGGRKGRQNPFAVSTEPLPELVTTMSIRHFVARLIGEVYSGKLAPKIGAGIAPLINLQLRTIEAMNSEDLKERLSDLEQQLEDLKTGQPSSSELLAGATN